MDTFHSGNYISQGWYNSFHPTFINKEWVINDMEVINLLSHANLSLGRLDMFSEYVPNIDLFISMHVYKEATKSSNIEGTQTRMDEALLDEEEVPLDKRDDWSEVHNYIKAMNYAMNELERLPLSSRLFKNIHATLMSGVRGEHKQPGEFRKSQNWIGGTSPSDAIFVPPVFNEIPELINDIEKFIHEPVCELPHLLKIALIHYQFETIHPFLDGNGRTGRLLITLYLVSKGLLKKPVLYLSDYLEKHRRTYYDKIMNVRLYDDLSGWLKFFLKGIIVTSENGAISLQKVMLLQKEFEEKVKVMGHRSANALRLLDFLYQNPVIDIKKAAKLLNVTYPSAKNLIEDFVNYGILKEVTGSKRGKRFVMIKYLEIFQ